MTKHIAPLPDPDGSLLLRELNHRVNNELTSTILGSVRLSPDRYWREIAMRRLAGLIALSPI